MKKLMAVGVVAAVVSCARAEDSFFGNLLSFAANEGAASSEAQGDSGIVKLNQQIKDLTERIENAKNMPRQKLDELKEKLESLQNQLKAKIDDLKKQRQAKVDAEKAKVDAEKAKVEQIKKDGETLVDSFKSLFK